MLLPACYRWGDGVYCYVLRYNIIYPAENEMGVLGGFMGNLILLHRYTQGEPLARRVSILTIKFRIKSFILSVILFA